MHLTLLGKPRISHLILDNGNNCHDKRRRRSPHSSSTPTLANFEPPTSHLKLVQPLHSGRNACGSAVSTPASAGVVNASIDCKRVAVGGRPSILESQSGHHWNVFIYHSITVQYEPYPLASVFASTSSLSSRHPPPPTQTFPSCLPEYRLPASKPWRRLQCSSLSRLAAYSSSTKSFSRLSHACVQPKKQTACFTLATSM